VSPEIMAYPEPLMYLLEYSMNTPEKTFSSPYKVIVGKKKESVKLDKNTEVSILNN
jgi:hypothetical protein